MMAASAWFRHLAAGSALLLCTGAADVSTAEVLPSDRCVTDLPEADQLPAAPLQPPAPELVSALTEWIGQHTPYDITGLRAAPPAIRLCRTGERLHYEGRRIVVEPDLRAAYDATARVIYLVAPWDHSSIADQGILLHELIHHVQFGARSWDCLQQPEYEAYGLQALWLEQHGRPVPFSLPQIFIWSRCPESHY